MSRLRKTQSVTCKDCLDVYQKRVDTMRNWNGLCRVCCNRHIVNTKIKGIIRVPIKQCVDCKKESRTIGKLERCFACSIPYKSGENHYKWKKDRSTLAKLQERNDTAYKEWRKQVWLRDNFKCKIANPDCLGKIEAHHILSWKDYPELRYEVNNGITLCHAHHPRARAEEARLAPYFMEIVSATNGK